MNKAKFEHAGLLAINPQAIGIEFMLGSVERQNRAIGNAAIVDVRGPLEHHAGGFFDNYESIKSRVATALASDAERVVLAFDSPGGLVSGVYEASKEIRAMAAAARKPLIAYVNGECCSAAYALACACEKIVVPSGATVGSIGVVAMAVDATAADKAMGLRFVALSSGARKLDGNPHVATTKDSESAIQKTVDDQAAVFFALVGASRGVSPDAVRGLQAGIFVGRQAVQIGLADEVSTLDELANNSATVATENTAMNYKEIRKALGEKSAGDDDEAKRCRAALAAMDGDGDSDKDEKKDDEAKAEAPAESDEDKKKKDDEAKASAAKAETDETAKAAATSNVISLASRVQTLEAERQAEKDATERTELLASRTDLVPAVRSWLEKQTLAVVRDAVKSLPKGPITVGSPAAAAQSDVKPTVGQTQALAQGAAGQLTEKQLLDERMGLGRNPMSAMSFDGMTHVMRTLTAEEARKVQAEKAKTAAGK